ncbi:MAG: vanadium-dependent haloperoxidase [Actinomycetota bacterium]|nr:vanadium-dependent haloperoxidase [Actinomycetota bacterium]
MTDRRTRAREVRREAADLAFDLPPAKHTTNGEEVEYGRPIANYSKGLPHDAAGIVTPAAYSALRKALSSGDPDDFEAIPLGTPGGRKLTNPQSGLAFDLEGPDAQAVTLAPAPRIDSAQSSAELGELYWMALLRDVRFRDYGTDPDVAAAVADLNTSFSDFRGPRDGGVVTPGTLFRGTCPGDLVGPYVSQFLVKDVQFGSFRYHQRQQTVAPGLNFLTTFADWLNAQNGGPFVPEVVSTAPAAARYIRNLRDLTHYVHVDALYEAYLNACLILLDLKAPFDPANPYQTSTNQEGFGTWGPPHILSLVTEVATRALKAVWYQKWFVHRRLRPEELGGRLEAERLGLDAFPMIDGEFLASGALAASQAANGGVSLLPSAFPEGCPTHPAYGSGHATVAGACVTVLKAFFDESWVIPNPQEPDASGTALVAYTGPDAGAMTVGGELNKVASNIGMARNAAGVHWRTDYDEAVRLGEAIAIQVLREQEGTYNEPSGLTISTFDGKGVEI